MAKLDEVLKLVRLYEVKYRHPNLTRFLVSNKYDLFPEKENMENCWPQCYPYADRPGVYLIMDDNENVLYVGKSSVAIGGRLGSYFCYDGERKCWVRSPYWSTSPKYIVAIVVPVDSAFECAALEEFLFANVQTTDNSVFQR